ncbi:MAG: diacylglycerol/lipid kinase family protein [Sphingomonadaceae bacterium]
MVVQTDTTGTALRSDSAAPVVGVIYNPRSHRNKGRDLDIAARPNVHLAQPRTREEIHTALAGFAELGVEYLIINGGDGTVRDVLTAGLDVFDNNWPALAVLPKGKTNALNVDLGAPSGWTLPDAVAAWDRGHRIVRRPLVVTPDAGGGPPLAGFILGAGGYAVGIRAGQDAHRLGAFNSLAVIVTAGWGVIQALLGSDANPWRRGAPMELLLGEERAALPHAGAGYEGRRSIMLASTLERFPGGIRLFGVLQEGLKIVVLDRPARRILAMMPLLLAGLRLADPERRGVHYRSVDSFELTIGEDYILDGEAFPAGHYRVTRGPSLRFVVP